MNYVNQIINECGLSKVQVAKYLGVSRQMLYNYLALPNITDLPKDKQNKLFSLFGVNSEEELQNIKIDDNFIREVEERVADGLMKGLGKDINQDFRGLNKKEQEILSDFIIFLKDNLLAKNGGFSIQTIKYLYQYLQIMKQVDELKYILVYMAKANGLVDPFEFYYDEDKQYTFEGILYSAITLYHNGTASRSKVSESHKKFEMEIEKRKEEKLSRTQELNHFKSLALKELGYTTINDKNSKEVFEKIAEIISRNNSI